MVCEKCEKKGKVGKLVTPNPHESTSKSNRSVGENKLLSSKKSRFNPYTDKFVKCKICFSKVHQLGSHYCQECAYKKSICAMCGKKLMKTKNYRQSSA